MEELATSETQTKQTEYDYAVLVIGSDKHVTEVALQLNKRFAASHFFHRTQLGKENLLSFKAPISGIPVLYVLRKLGFKVKKYDDSKKANVRHRDEDSRNVQRQQEAAAERLRKDAESAMLRDGSVLDSKEQDVQDTTASELAGQSNNSEASAGAGVGDSRTTEVG